MPLFANVIACIIIVSTWSSIVSGQGDSPPCKATTQKSIFFSNSQHKDELHVSVEGQECNLAIVAISVIAPTGEVLYHYQGDFIDHMPFMIYAPELNKLVQLFVNKVAEEAANRLTSDLPAYTNTEDFYDANNDFVIVPIPQYEALREEPRPLLWHATGNSSWQHVIYNRELHASQVIMRGGIFHKTP